MDSRVSLAACCRPQFLHGWKIAALLVAMGLSPYSIHAAETAEGEANSKPSPAPTAAAVPKLTAAELAREIDVLIERGLQSNKLPASPPASDSEFLRRVYLDITGVIPPLGRVKSFLSDLQPNKRERLVDELLESEEYVRHMTDQWREHLIPSTAAAARRRHETGILWLEEAFRANRPYDQFVREILTAEGFQRDNGAVTFLVTHQSLDEVTDRLSRVLLGVQIVCAQCHNHPFAAWKQEDYWGTAAFFSKVRPQYERIDRVEHYGISERGDRKTLMAPPSLKEVAPTFLGGAQPDLDQSEPYLPVFVDWLASAENPYFARAFANRLWRTVMGRGLVEPVDDLRDDNPGTHPELLALLGQQFRQNSFDIHYLLRALTLSNTYGRTSRTLDANQSDTEWYSHMPVKVMSPYARYDSVQTVMRIGDPPAATPSPATTPPAATSPVKQEPAATATATTATAAATTVTAATVTATPVATGPQPLTDEQLKASQRARGVRDSYAGFFKGEDNPSPLAYEAGVPQALRMMNSQEMHRGTRVISELSREHNSPEALVGQLYLAALTREPTDEERQIVMRFLKSQPDARRALADVVWTLLNSAEFVTNH